jgi:hypothetical protein
MVRDARLRPSGCGGLLTMRVSDLILRVFDLIPESVAAGGRLTSDLILRSIAKRCVSKD